LRSNVFVQRQREIINKNRKKTIRSKTTNRKTKINVIKKIFSPPEINNATTLSATEQPSLQESNTQHVSDVTDIILHNSNSYNDDNIIATSTPTTTITNNNIIVNNNDENMINNNIIVNNNDENYDEDDNVVMNNDNDLGNDFPNDVGNNDDTKELSIIGSPPIYNFEKDVPNPVIEVVNAPIRN
jgi:hypothetical protein